MLVVLHGLFGNVDNFRSLALHFENRLTVLRLDLPGHGQSPWLPSLSLDAMSQAVISELEARGIAEFYLLGHSLGGKVAMCMAGDSRCSGLQKLVVVDIAPKDYPPHHEAIFKALQSVELQNLTTRAQANEMLSSEVSDAGVRSFLLKSLFRDDSNEWRWRFDLQQLADDYALIAQAPTIQQPIHQPTLFIKGGASDYLMATDEPLIKRFFTAPSLKVIADAGHWPHAEKPAQFNRICQNFLDVSHH